MSDDSLFPDNISIMAGVTRLDIPPERILRGAAAMNLKTVLVIGWNENGELYAAGSAGDTAENLLLCETFKHKLLSGDFG